MSGVDFHREPTRADLVEDVEAARGYHLMRAQTAHVAHNLAFTALQNVQKAEAALDRYDAMVVGMHS